MTGKAAKIYQKREVRLKITTMITFQKEILGISRPINNLIIALKGIRVCLKRSLQVLSIEFFIVVLSISPVLVEMMSL